jgi:hypothetical protein
MNSSVILQIHYGITYAYSSTNWKIRSCLRVMTFSKFPHIIKISMRIIELKNWLRCSNLSPFRRIILWMITAITKAALNFNLINILQYSMYLKDIQRIKFLRWYKNSQQHRTLIQIRWKIASFIIILRKIIIFNKLLARQSRPKAIKLKQAAYRLVWKMWYSSRMYRLKYKTASVTSSLFWILLSLSTTNRLRLRTSCMSYSLLQCLMRWRLHWIQ